MFANATVSFQQLVCTYPGPLMLVCILVRVLLKLAAWHIHMKLLSLFSLTFYMGIIVFELIHKAMRFCNTCSVQTLISRKGITRGG